MISLFPPAELPIRSELGSRCEAGKRWQFTGVELYPGEEEVKFFYQMERSEETDNSVITSPAIRGDRRRVADKELWASRTFCSVNRKPKKTQRLIFPVLSASFITPLYDFSPCLIGSSDLISFTKGSVNLSANQNQLLCVLHLGTVVSSHLVSFLMTYISFLTHLVLIILFHSCGNR